MLLPFPLWRHQMETFSALLALCEGNPLVTGGFLSQRPVTRSFDVFFDLHLNKRLSKQSWGWWFETLSYPLWRHCNVLRGIFAAIVAHNKLEKVHKNALRVTLNDYTSSYSDMLEVVNDLRYIYQEWKIYSLKLLKMLKDWIFNIWTLSSFPPHLTVHMVGLN